MSFLYRKKNQVTELGETDGVALGEKETGSSDGIYSKAWKYLSCNVGGL